MGRPSPVLDSPVFRSVVAALIVSVVGASTYFPVLIVRVLAADTLWPVPAGERWVARLTIGWLILMGITVLGMAMYVADSLRAKLTADG